MSTTDHLEWSFKNTAENTPYQEKLSLEDLIAEIDGKMMHPSSDDAALQKPVKKSPSIQAQYIQFILDETFFGLSLSHALEIGRNVEITPLPNLPEWALGVGNVRGEIVSFISLKSFLDIQHPPSEPNQPFIIVHSNRIKVGLLVDHIVGLISLDRIKGEIRTNPYHEGEISQFISGVFVSEKSLTNILSVDALLHSPRMNSFN